MFCLIKWDLHSFGILFSCFQPKNPFLGFLIVSALITNQRQDYFQVLLSSCAKNNGVLLRLPRENNLFLLNMGFSHRQFYRHLHDLSPCQLIRSKNTACWFWSTLNNNNTQTCRQKPAWLSPVQWMRKQKQANLIMEPEKHGHWFTHVACMFLFSVLLVLNEMLINAVLAWSAHFSF